VGTKPLKKGAARVKEELNLNIRLCRSTTEPSVNLTLVLINLI
jgi:hypothetical protein